MPADFVSQSDAELWTPVRASTTGEGGGTNFQIAARLVDGAEWAQAGAQLESISNRDLFRSRGLGDDTTAVLGVVPMQAAVTSFVREPIVMLGAAVVAVLLIACVNLAALLLARGASRSKEVATRMALGSGRGAVIRQLMTEAAVLAFAGGALGLLVVGLADEVRRHHTNDSVRLAAKRFQSGSARPSTGESWPPHCWCHS
jgi:hypothetical protein